MTDGLKRTERLALGIVLERRKGAGPWREFSWRPVSVIPGAPPPGDGGRTLAEGDGWARLHVATLELELHRADTDGYRLTLSQEPPRLWVALRDEGTDGAAPEPFFVTASAHEAELYQVSGNEMVEAVPMPLEVLALVRDFVEQHHVDVPFEKRERKRHEGDGFGRRRPNA